MRHLRRTLVPLLAVALLATAFAATAVAADPSTTALAVADGSAQKDNNKLTIVATVGPTDATGGTVDFFDNDAADPTIPIDNCDDVVVDVGNTSSCTIDDPGPVGTRHYKAAYSGNVTLDPSESIVLDVTIVADTVDASGVGRNYPTFYPVHDGYRDVLTIFGDRDEPISVTIRIYNSSNVKVKQIPVALGSGHYAVTWNGRNSSGTILAAGKYKIVQTLTDTHVTKAFTSYSNLSKKKLVTKTASVTKDGDKIAFWQTSGSGTALHNSAGLLRLKAGNGATLAAWSFKMPSSVIDKSVTFSVYSTAKTVVPPTFIGIQNFNNCPSGYGCFSRTKNIGTASGTKRWYTISGSAAYLSSGQTIHAIAVVDTGSVDIYKVKATLTYQILQ